MNISTMLRGMLTFVLAVAATLTVSAQSRTVSGTVTDNQGQPVIGATVLAQVGGEILSAQPLMPRAITPSKFPMEPKS